MKIQTDVNRVKASNMPTTGVEFGIKNASLIMGFMSDEMYSYPVRTTVQEYLSNARDAMRAVKNTTDKIILIAPTELNPNFSVRDFGISMTDVHMNTVFSQYGASDKRNSDSLIGGWGLGSKIAWSTVDCFTIICYLDGEKRTYLAHKGINNNGMLSDPIVEQTDEANGVEIIIPVEHKNILEYKNGIERAILFCKNEVEVRGLLPEEIRTAEMEEIEEDFFIARKGDLNPILGLDSYNDNPIAVIDGVPYVISQGNEHLTDLESMLKNTIPVFIVKTGDLDVPVQREALKYSEKTKENLTTLGEWAVDSLKRHITSQFEACNDAKEFFALYRAMRKAFKFGRLVKPEFDVYKIRDGLIESEIIERVKIQLLHNKSKRYPHRIIQKITRHSVDTIHIDNLDNVFFVDDSTETKGKQNRRVRTHLEGSKDLVLMSPIILSKDDAMLPVATDLSPADCFLKLVRDFGLKPISSIEMADPIKREKSESEKGVIKVHSWKYGRKQIEDINLEDLENEFLYVVMEDRYFSYEDGTLYQLSHFTKLRDDKEIVGLSVTNAKRILTNNHFSPLEDWIKAYVPIKRDYDSIRYSMCSHRTTDALGLVSSMRKAFGELGTTLANKDFENQMSWIEDNTPKAVADTVPNVIFELMDTKDLKIETDQFVSKCTEFHKLFKTTFPLLESVYGWTYGEKLKESAIYMKAKLDN